MTCMPFRPDRPDRNNDAAARQSRNAGKNPPPEETLEEPAYLKMLGEKQKPVIIKLADGEQLHGWIEYYDKNMVRLTREGAPNLFIFKHEIHYIQEDNGKRNVSRPATTESSS